MKDRDRQEWNRHYDTIHWVITGIVLAALGTLVLRTLDCDKTPWFTNPAGVIVSFIGLYFIATFRRWMHVLNGDIIDIDYRQLQAKIRAARTWRTWSVLVVCVSFIDALFIVRFYLAYWETKPDMLIVLAPSPGPIGYAIYTLWRYGNSEEIDEPPVWPFQWLHEWLF